ncbi:MAG TPA: hypothetical protein VJR94_07585 [Candidatus Nitrosocosmicus sp.]|nr:hypothetical protein [Candidatus Nitrosocosmicus sp.]
MSNTISGSYPEYDAVVIGAGHNRLTCGCYLVKAGLSVLVIEEYYAIGDMTMPKNFFNRDLNQIFMLLAIN